MTGVTVLVLGPDNVLRTFVYPQATSSEDSVRDGVLTVVLFQGTGDTVDEIATHHHVLACYFTESLGQS